MMEDTCTEKLRKLQSDLEMRAREDVYKYKNWINLGYGKLDKTDYTYLVTGQIFLFQNWDGSFTNDPYKGDKESFGKRPRWFFLGQSKEAFRNAAQYGGGGAKSWNYHSNYEQFRKPNGTFWDSLSPRVISYAFKTDAKAPKLLDGRDQSKYEEVLMRDCAIQLLPRNQHHSIDKWQNMMEIVGKFQAAGIDGILEAESATADFTQVVLFQPEKHLNWANTIAGRLQCKDAEGPHYSYTFLQNQQWDCDFRSGYRVFSGKYNMDANPPTPIFCQPNAPNC